MKKRKRRKSLKKRNIAFDIDGVLCDFNREFLGRLSEHFKMDLPKEPNEYNYIFEDYPELTQDMVNTFFEEQVKDGMFAHCFPHPESQIFLNKLLKDERFEVYFITARGTEHTIHWTSEFLDRVHTDTKIWLKKYFPLFNQENLIFSKDKDVIIHEKKCELMVEDKYTTAEKLGKLCKSLLITRGWNKNNQTKNCTRINSIAEVDFFL